MRTPFLPLALGLLLSIAARKAELDRLRPLSGEALRQLQKHHDVELIVFLGPRSQELLLPFLKPQEAEAFIFCPQDAEEERNGERRRNRKSNSFGTRSSTKRAVVTLAGGDKIDLFEKS